MVQWLRLHLTMQEIQSRSLIPGAKIPQASWLKNQNIKNSRSNIVTNSIKTLKMVHIKKKILKKNPNRGI